jgi:hypothetical protein
MRRLLRALALGFLGPALGLGASGCGAYPEVPVLRAALLDPRVLVTGDILIERVAVDASPGADLPVLVVGGADGRSRATYATCRLPADGNGSFLAGGPIVLHGDGAGFLDLRVGESGEDARWVVGVTSPAAAEYECRLFEEEAAPGPWFGAAGAVAVDGRLGDFDGDGDLDVATANLGFDEVIVHDGTDPGRTERIPAGGTVSHLFVADLDGDGLDDVVATEAGDQGLRLLRGHPTSILVEDEPPPPSGGVDPVGLVVFDANGDAVPDLCVPTSGGDALLCYLGLGDGRFLPPSSSPIGVPSGWLPGRAAAGDLDRDGRLDVVVAYADPASGTGVLGVLVGDGEGGFAAGFPAFTSLPFVPYDLAVLDTDDDGDPEVVVVGSGRDEAGVTHGAVVALSVRTGPCGPECEAYR